MSGDAAVDQLILASAHSLVGRPFTALAVDGAVDALVAGLDGDALRELAGLSRSSREETSAPCWLPRSPSSGCPNRRSLTRRSSSFATWDRPCSRENSLFER